MSNSRTLKVAVLACMVTMGGAFVAPAPRAKVAGTPTSRGETSAVSPLNVAGFSLTSVTGLFTRKSALLLAALRVPSCLLVVNTGRVFLEL